MTKTGAWGLFCCVLLAGCASIEPPEPGANHPASPEAASAVETQRPSVLAVDENNLPQAPPEMRHGDMMHHGHEGMEPERMGGGSSQTDRKATAYTCPMHPDVMAAQPGKCPKCGMDLVPKGGPADE